MNKLLKTLRNHKYIVHLISFTITTAASLGLYFTAQYGLQSGTLGLLAAVILANLLSMSV